MRKKTSDGQAWARWAAKRLTEKDETITRLTARVEDLEAKLKELAEPVYCGWFPPRQWGDDGDDQ